MNVQRSTWVLFAIAVNGWINVPIAFSQNLTDQWVEKAARPLVEDQVVDGLSVGYIQGKHQGIVHLGSCNPAGKRPDDSTLYEIGSVSKVDVKEAVDALPDPIAPDIFYCGYAAESSFGAASYLVRREGGNVLVDSPRAARPLMDRIEALGGVATMFLSHRDDVGAMMRLGADIERTVLARAVRWHCEDRVLRAGDTTVVF